MFARFFLLLYGVTPPRNVKAAAVHTFVGLPPPLKHDRFIIHSMHPPPTPKHTSTKLRTQPACRALPARASRCQPISALR